MYRLADSISYRNIVQIRSEDESRLRATILTASDYRLAASDTPIFEFEERPGDSPMALHRWFYPGDRFGQQFIYFEYIARLNVRAE